MPQHRTLVSNYLIWTSLFLLLLAAPAQGATVLFDQGHGQAFVVEKNGPLDLSQIAALFKEQGLKVKAGQEPLSRKTLKGISGLVISGPFKPFAAEEMESIHKFIQEGGRLSLMLHIPHPVQPLLRALGIAHSQSPLNEQENIIEGNGKNFKVVNLSPHPLTKGLSAFNAYGVWGVMPKKGDSQMIATTSAKAWIDMNNNNLLDPDDGVYAYGMAVAGSIGKGSFVVFGDDAIFQNQFLSNENLQLGRNLAHWLKGGK